MMPTFDRQKQTNGRSFALRVFNAHETEINEHFWSFKVISEHARFIAAQEKISNPKALTAQIFKASGPDSRRIPTTVTDWLSARDELENWLRLSALVSVAAYHETYLRQVIRTALMADPLVRQNASKKLDGTILLKKDVELSYDYEIELITRGDWGKRFSAFERLFGRPGAEAFPISELEDIRKARNDIAHGFGRNLDVPEPSDTTVKPARRLSQTKFIKLISIISRSAKAIDKHILDKFIGEFELVHAYHIWRSNFNVHEAGRTEIRNFQKYIHGQLGLSKSSIFCKDLICYYNKIL